MQEPLILKGLDKIQKVGYDDKSDKQMLGTSTARYPQVRQLHREFLRAGSDVMQVAKENQGKWTFHGETAKLRPFGPFSVSKVSNSDPTPNELHCNVHTDLFE